MIIEKQSSKFRSSEVRIKTLKPASLILSSDYLDSELLSYDYRYRNA